MVFTLREVVASVLVYDSITNIYLFINTLYKRDKEFAIRGVVCSTIKRYITRNKSQVYISQGII